MSTDPMSTSHEYGRAEILQMKKSPNLIKGLDDFPDSGFADEQNSSCQSGRTEILQIL